jgi:hypothetical protein
MRLWQFSILSFACCSVAKKIRFACYWGTPLVNMSEVVGNHLENLLEGLEGVGNPLANF